MKLHPKYKETIKKFTYKYRYLLYILLILIIAISTYFTYILFSFVTDSPINDDNVNITPEITTDEIDNNEVDSEYEVGTDFEVGVSYIEIPSIKLKLGVYTDTKNALEKGIRNVYPKRLISQNIVLTGHRFSIGLTKEGIKRGSPLYHIEKINKGDNIFYTLENKTYKYKVKEVSKVSSNDVYIESNNNNSMITLYSCSLLGEQFGRYVVKAYLEIE